MKMRTYTFTVEGRGMFPLDMLRHDCCFPASSADSARMEQNSERREVTLVCRTDRARWQPTEGRWNSFLWSVGEVQEVR